jgi:hypothetical protein
LDENEGSRRFELGSQALAAALGAAAGLPFGPVSGIIGAAAGPALVPAAEQILTELGLDGRRRSGAALAAACDVSGLPLEEILKRISSDEKLRLLAGIVIASATRTAWDDKVRTLGRSLASGLLATDDAEVDTEQLVIASISDIEAPQLCLLELLVCWQPPPFGYGLPEPHHIASDPSSMRMGATWNAGLRTWTVVQIGSARPRLVPVLPSLLGMLQRHGLAIEEPGSGNIGPTANLRGKPQSTWSPTELGELVYLRFKEAGAGVPDTWLTASS